MSLLLTQVFQIIILEASSKQPTYLPPFLGLTLFPLYLLTIIHGDNISWIIMSKSNIQCWCGLPTLKQLVDKLEIPNASYSVGTRWSLDNTLLWLTERFTLISLIQWHEWQNFIDFYDFNRVWSFSFHHCFLPLAILLVFMTWVTRKLVLDSQVWLC